MSLFKRGILHRVATGGGTGTGILGEVNTFSDLPVSATTGDRYLVLTYSISTPTKLKGVYRWNGSSWDRQNGARAFDVVYDNSGSTLTSVNLEASTNELDTKVNGKEPSFTKNTAFNKNFGTTSGTVAEGNDSRFTNHLSSFTQNSGQYIATEGIRARDNGGVALLNDDGTGGVTVADNGDVNITTKITTSEVKAKDANGLKLHDDGGNGIFVKDGGNVEMSNRLKVNGNLGSSIPTSGGLESVGFISTGDSGSNVVCGVSASNGVPKIYGYDWGTSSAKDLFIQYLGGNVAIGSNAPTEKLDVNGNAKISGKLGIGKNPSQYAVLDMEMAVTSGSGAGINLKNTASGNSYAVLNLNGNNGGVIGQYYAGGGSAVLRTFTNHGLIFGTNATERARITNGGNFGIGTSSPSQKLHVNGNAIVSGSLSKGSGSFDIAHPDPDKKDTHRLRHYFVETPSAGGNIYKYQIKCKEGNNYIDLPDYFQFLNKDSLVWVNPFKHFGRAWGEVKDDKKIKIVAEQKGVYNILVFGDRKDEAAMKDFNKYGIEYKIKK